MIAKCCNKDAPATMQSKLEKYHASEREMARTQDLLSLLPQGRESVLDIGARDGHFARLLSERFAEVTALDLQRPRFEIPNVVTVEGDVTNLQFASESFDCVFCAEVLEHVLEIQKACREIARVAKYEVLIGVPFKQDTRLGRCRCHGCGNVNPPWGHVNTFDLKKLIELFPKLDLISVSFVGSTRETTNRVSVFLMDLAGNPWGTYEQEEPCIYCGTKMNPPGERPVWQRGLSHFAAQIDRVQAACAAPHANWVHALFSQRGD